MLYMTLILAKELNVLFENKIKTLNTSFEETKAYIQGVYIEYVNKNNILSQKDSITLKYIEANQFVEFQELADWILFVRTTYPKSLRSTPNYYDSIAKSSYYKCHMLMNKKWLVFEELSDRFSDLVEAIVISNQI